MKRSNKALKYVSLLIIGIVLGTFFGVYIDSKFLTKPVVVEREEGSNPVKQVSGENQAEIRLAAVDSEGNGTTSMLTVTTKPGTGLVLVNVNNILADYYTQYSAREAVLAVEEYLNASLKDTDVMFQIDTGSKKQGGVHRTGQRSP